MKACLACGDSRHLKPDAVLEAFGFDPSVPEKILGEVRHVRSIYCGSAGYLYCRCDVLKFLNENREALFIRLSPMPGKPGGSENWVFVGTIEPRIYFVSDKVSGNIKIGTAYNIPRRLHSLRLMNAGILGVLAIGRGNTEAEARLHKTFRNSRLHGEWFHPSSDLIRYIEGIRAVSNGGAEA